MNNWQIIRQLKYWLEKRRWEGNPSAEPVFGIVRVAFSPPMSLIQETRFPAVFIIVGGSVADDEEPGLVTQDYDIRLVNKIGGDSIGENGIIGAHRTSYLKGAGRGLLEIEEELLDTVRKMGESAGIRIIERARTGGMIDELAESGYIISRMYSVQTYCTDRKFYHPATRLVAVVTGANVNLSWELPPERFDRREVRLRRASGSTPPPTVNDGTAITLGGLLAMSVTDGPLASGQYSYSLFAGYDEWQVGSSGKWSERISRTVTVV